MRLIEYSLFLKFTSLKSINLVHTSFENILRPSSFILTFAFHPSVNCFPLCHSSYERVE